MYLASYVRGYHHRYTCHTENVDPIQSSDGFAPGEEEEVLEKKILPSIYGQIHDLLHKSQSMVLKKKKYARIVWSFLANHWSDEFTVPNIHLN